MMASLQEQEVLDRLEERLQALWWRDGFDVPDPAGSARLIRLLLQQEGSASRSAARILEDSGIRAQWNAVFAARRSRVVAEWLRPHLRAEWLDVLAGDFTLTRALHATGCGPWVAVERRSAYETDWSAQPFPVVDLAELPSLAGRTFGSALVCTVLHHEPDPVGLLNALGTLRCERWVVVENCLDEENSEAFHLFVDEFFNLCLNQFAVPCVPQHRTRAGWVALLERYGRVSHREQKADIPGIPFPYDLFVVER